MMFNLNTILFTCMICIANTLSAQHTSVPEEVDTMKTYLFYLHGGVVQDQGRNAVSDYYGEYLYDAILDTLQNRGFIVISEVRPKDTDDDAYAQKISSEVKSLMSKGVSVNNIVIVGASAGAYLTLEVSKIINQREMRYVLIGLCSDYAVDYYAKDQAQIIGRFLSIYEKSDSKKSCKSIFANRSKDIEFTEIVLNMGIDHAFLYKPFKEWVDPICNWVIPN